MFGKMSKSASSKNALKLCSIILATLLLATSILTGNAPLSVKAEAADGGYVLKANTSDWPYFGQNVLLQAGETYVFSYYFKGSTHGDAKFLDGNNNEGYEGAVITPSNPTYDSVYNKVQYEFVAPANATVPDTSNPEQVRIYLGIRPNTQSIDTYFYGMTVYAKNDSSKTNLFNDSDFSNSENFSSDSVGNWYSPYHSALDKWKFSRESLESLGGLDFFKKTDSDRYVISLANGAGWDYFGQFVSLDPNKTYIYSYYYKAGAETYPQIFKNKSEGKIEPIKTAYDREYSRMSVTFRPSTDADSIDDTAVSGNKLVYLGIRQPNSTGAPLYFAGFSVVDAENPSVNLLRDSELLENGLSIHAGSPTSIWKDAYDGNIPDTYSKVTLASAGGMDYFKRPDSDKHVLKYAITGGWVHYGQWVSLAPGKTYTYSYYAKPGTTTYPQLIKNADGTQFDPIRKVTDRDYNKISCTFTPPADAVDDTAIPGNKLIYLGICQNNQTDSPIYFYGFSVVADENPTIELFNDNELLGNNHGLQRDIWKYPGGGSLGWDDYFEEPLDSIGGMDYFKRPDSNKAVIALASNQCEWFGQWVSLNPEKTYVFSYYHLPGTENYPQIIKNKDEQQIPALSTVYDEEYCKVTRTFKPATDANTVDDTNIPGNKLVWLGVRDGAGDNPNYYYGFNLCASDNMSVNLFNNSECLDADSHFTKDKFTNLYSGDTGWKYTIVSLESVGGMNTFKYTDSTSRVLRVAAGEFPFFGQWLSLSPEKTYAFSYYFVDGSANYWQVLKNEVGEQVENCSVSYDDIYSKITVTFSPSIADDSTDDPQNPGNKLVYVGIRGENADKELYFYDFKVCDITSPDLNLMSDGNLQAIGSNVSDSWVNLYKENPSLDSGKFSETTLSELGGFDYFLIPLTFESKCDVNADNEVTVIDLVHIKKYAAEIISEMPKGRGDLDNDGEIGKASDVNILRKVLLGTYTESINIDIELFAGATPQALAMRNSVLNAEDNLTSAGTTYYVSQNGSNSNNGKSPENAYASIRQAFLMAGSGDTVLLERGSTFRISDKLELKSGVNYGAYGIGEKPEVLGSPMNYAQSALWTESETQNVWQINYSRTDAGIIVFNNGELAGDIKADISALTKDGDYYFVDEEDKLYIYSSKGNPGTVYSDIEIGSDLIMFYIPDGAQNIKIDNLTLKYTGTFAIRGSRGCNNIDITNCEVGWVGGSPFGTDGNRYGNAIEFTAGCSNVTIENCWIYQAFDAGITFQITQDADLAWKTFEHINVNLNLIEYCSWGLEWWPSSNDCTFSDISVTGNIFRLTGYGWAGDTRSPAHIRGPWTVMTFTPNNFVISQNIFDCSNGPIYAWPWGIEEQPGHIMSENTYYQLMPTASVDCVFDIGYGNATRYAHNQQEFETAVRSIDPSAALIKWLNRG